MRTSTALGATAIAVAATTVTAAAFCGFYVAGSDAKMFADATNVVLMRDGTRTVLAMQNAYRGPLDDFALVVPVPVVLKESDVRVVPRAAFDRIDSLGSPRLVEYWEQDPCPPPPPPRPRDPKELRAMRVQNMPIQDTAPVASSVAGGGRGSDAPMRMAVAPKLATFSASPTSITAGVATPITWSFQYSNEPYPEPSCSVDHGVGNVYPGATANLTLSDSGMVTLTCANSAGRAVKQVKINVVKIEAKFDVAEYQILILSATEATGLEEWLRLNKYKIPAGAEPLLRPYVEGGSKFFVAKVDPKKVKMENGQAMLSPLRFHYDSEEFALPIRLGMANSSGKQDLIINIISADKRYEVANYKNVMIPTNFDVKPAVKTRFAEFYAALFDKTLEANPRSVVTEYAWATSPNMAKCDPCPPEIPNDADILALGGDVVGGRLAQGYFVLTRLHARYGKADMKDDLRFKEAAPITGGREVWGKQGLEYGAQPAPQNNFQARYAIRYWWTGPIRCASPQRGRWGGPPGGGFRPTIAASKTAFAPRGKLALDTVIKRDLWEIRYKKAPAVAPAGGTTPPKPKSMWFGGGIVGGVMLVGLGALIARRRRAGGMS